MKYGEEAVYALLDLLNEAEVHYMMVGSFSSNAYGEPRATKENAEGQTTKELKELGALDKQGA
jgi:hypothetical protein